MEKDRPVLQLLQGTATPEVLVPEEELDPSKKWTSQVFDHFKDKCGSCGSQDHLKAKLIVPESAGGAKTLGNSVLLCRVCDLASEIMSREKVKASGENTRPINFWIARSLHNALRNGLSHNYGFNSVASVVRFLMGRYLEAPDQFQDVELYVDRSTEVKVNVWVPYDMYEKFKTSVTGRGLTVTDSLRGLLRMYEAEAGKIFGRIGK
jgi:hypothetical protein